MAIAPKAYQSKPPVIRERLPTLELVDDDIVDSAPAARPSSAPPPPPPRTTTAPPPPAVPTELRGSVPDPTDLLFDGMYELNFVDTPWQAANVCARALLLALRARTVVIHAHDLETRELRAIGAHGAKASDLLGSAESSDDDFVASAVMANQKPLTMRFEGELPRLAPRRLSVVGAEHVLVAVPAIAWGRCVAMIEVVDADERLSHRVADCAAYVAERLAAFLSARAAA